MTNANLIFALAVGITILVGMLIVAHVSSAWLKASRQVQDLKVKSKAALDEPSLPFVEIVTKRGFPLQFYGSGKVAWKKGQTERAS